MRGFLEGFQEAFVFTSLLAVRRWSKHSLGCVSGDLALPMSKDRGSIKEGVVFLNHAGASPSPDCVVDRVISHLKLEQQVGGYTAAEMVSDELQDVYRRIADLLGSKSTENIALVESATVGWTRLFYSMVDFQHKRRTTQQRRVILVSEAEYAANVVAACEWAKDHRELVPSWTVLTLPSIRSVSGNSTGKVDVQALHDMLHGNYQYRHNGNNKMAQLDPQDIAIVCVTHIPTNSGIVNDVEGIGRLIANYNNQQDSTPGSTPRVFYLVDACQSVGHRRLNIHEIQCHGLIGTGRKFLRGPRGTGFLCCTISSALRPHHVDHVGVPVVQREQSLLPVEDWIQVQPKRGAKRFEFYESSVAGKLGLGEAVRFATEEVGVDVIQSASLKLAQTLYSKLQSSDQVKLYHQPECGIVTFHVFNIDSSIVKRRLDGTFETSVVPSTSTPLDSSTVPDLVRVSLNYSNGVDDLNKFCMKLQEIIEDSM